MTVNELLVHFLLKVINNCSDEIRQVVKETLDRAEEKAKVSSNPFDDILIKLLKTLLGF